MEKLLYESFLRFAVGLGLGLTTFPALGQRSLATYSLAIQPIGFHDGYSTALIGNYFYQPDLHLGFKYQASEDVGMTASNRRAHTNLLAVTSGFSGNSFYFEAGLGALRQIVHRTNKDLWSGTVESESRYLRTDAGVLFGIGNQWQFRRFTLGCEWVGLYQSLVPAKVKGYTRHYENAGTYQEYAFTKTNDRRDQKLRFLNLHLGLAF